MTDELLAILKKECASMEKSADILDISYKKCKMIGIQNNYSLQDLEAFEALTARFARLSDLLLQKIFRLIDTIELVQDGTLLDRIHRAEKRNLISSAKQFTELRHLRNSIAHEYEPDEYMRIFKDVLAATGQLLDATEKTSHYCNRLIRQK